MAERGFMGKISRWFSGPSDTYFFGLQIAIKCFGEDTLRARFAHVIEESRTADENVQEKRRFLKRFVALLEELVASQPRTKAIHIILDNLSTHKTQRVRDFLKRHRNVTLHYTPTYSSWLNQVEIWFSKIERDVVARGVFTSVDDLARKLLRYIDRYNRKPRRIKWSYSDVTRRIKYTAESSGTLH